MRSSILRLAYQPSRSMLKGAPFPDWMAQAASGNIISKARTLLNQAYAGQQLRFVVNISKPNPNISYYTELIAVYEIV